MCNYLKYVKSDVQHQINTCLKTEDGVIQLTEEIILTGSYTHNDVTTPYKFPFADDVTLIGNYLFCGATSLEIDSLNGLTTRQEHNNSISKYCTLEFCKQSIPFCGYHTYENNIHKWCELFKHN